jgi:hypothetical protein
MTLSRLRARLNQAAPPLDPPPTPEELAWWEVEKKSVRRKHRVRYMLLMAAPFFVGIMLRDAASESLAHRLLQATVTSLFLAIGGEAATWGTVREARLRASVVGHRIRENLRREAELARVESADPAPADRE